MINFLLALLVKIDWWLCFNIPIASLRLRWHRLWVRKGVGHPSLILDDLAAASMTSEELESYRKELNERQTIAYVRDFKSGKDCRRA